MQCPKKFTFLRFFGLLFLTGFELVLNVAADDGNPRSSATRPLRDLNRTRIITTIDSPPFLYYTNENGTARFEGYIVDLAAAVADIVGFKYELHHVADGYYGSMRPNGEWTGMMGELINGDADMAIAPLTVTSSRQKVVDFTNPFMSSGISLMIKKPEQIEPSLVFLEALSSDIWFYIGLAYIGVSITLFLVLYFSRDENRPQITIKSSPDKNITKRVKEKLAMLAQDLLNAFWFSIGALMHQDSGIRLRSLSSRLAASVWWLFALIIVLAYTANLAILLTEERNALRLPIESVHDLLERSDIKYGTIRSGSTAAFFKYAVTPVYQQMWARMESEEPSVFVNNISEGVQRVRESNGKYVFFVESVNNAFINARAPCNTMMVGPLLDSKFYAIATPKGSDLKDELDLAILQLREMGTLQTLVNKWWYEKAECDGGLRWRDQSQAPLTPSNVAGAFYILIAGLALATIVCLCEFVYRIAMNARKRKASDTNQSHVTEEPSHEAGTDSRREFEVTQ